MATPPDKTIPSSFVRLDSTATAADEFVNVRDLQVIRDNHNLMLARLMRPMVVCDEMDGGNIQSPYALNRKVTTPFWYNPISLTQHANSITVKILARIGGVDSEITSNIYAVCDSSDMKHPDDMKGASSVAIATGTSTWYTIANVPVYENRMQGGHGNHFLYLYADGGLVGSDLLTSGTATVDAVSETGMRITFSGATGTNPGPGQCLYFPGALSVGHRMITSAVNTSGSVWEVQLDAPLGVMPTVGTTTVNTRRPMEIRVYSIVVAEDAITDIDEDIEFPNAGG